LQPWQREQGFGGTTGKLAFADALRGVACVAVVASHLLELFWVRSDEATQFANAPPLPAGTGRSAFVSVTEAMPHFGFGQFGVALFFLISGFVIPLSLARTSAAGFCLGRLWRIVPTYMVCFAVTVLAIVLAGAHYERVFPFTAREVALHAVPGARLVADSRFVDLVIWTLEIEIMFYVMCAVAAPVLRRQGAGFMLLPVAVLVAVVSARHWVIFTIYAPHLIFIFVGVALSAWHSGRLRSAATLGCGVACLMLAGCALAISPNPKPEVVVVSSIAALVLFLTAYAVRARIRLRGVVRMAALVSYPLYLVHATAGYALMRVLLDLYLPPDVVASLAVVAVVAIAAVVHVAVERPTQAIGQRWARQLTAAISKVERQDGHQSTWRGRRGVRRADQEAVGLDKGEQQGAVLRAYRRHQG
jgi:peptidoglycan/LPS O-acetylase OafA/YrhL